MMIIPDDDVPKVSTPPFVTDPMIEDVPDPEVDPPPAYFASESRTPLNITTSRLPSSLSLRRKSTNYTYLTRTNQSIRASFVIDPLITIPRLLLPPLSANEKGGNRKNLQLDARNGSINADITLLSGTENLSLNEAKLKKHTTIYIKSDNGTIDAKLRVDAASTSGIVIPFKLRAIGYNGSVNVGLPRNFEGLLTIFSKNGPVKLSDEISDRVSTFTEDRYTLRCFVGDLSLLAESHWNGNEVNIEATNGRVKVYLLD
jgi:hypothetical protein